MRIRTTIVLASLATVFAMAGAPSLWADRGGAMGGGPAGGNGGGGAGGGGSRDTGGGPEAGGTGGGSTDTRGDRKSGGGMEDDACGDDAQRENDSDAREDFADAVFTDALGAANRTASE